MTATLPGSGLIDASRWPDVASVPAASVRTRAARWLFARAVADTPIRVVCEDGVFGGGGPGDPEMVLYRPDAFYRRLGNSGLIGFGESYMAGEWSAPDLAAVLTPMAARIAELVPVRLQSLRSLAVRRRPAEQDNTLAGSRRNIHRHYDLSNELFGLFLDDTLSYSSALFASDPEQATESLSVAQHRKIDRMLDLADVHAGTNLLEIGTGWGELAIRAAARGAHVTTLTISAAQAELAARRIQRAGLSDRVTVRLADYREIGAGYDAVVSVEMIEAVGAEHWHRYFASIAGALRPGGRAALQAITMPHDRMQASRDTYTWVVKYIFPGGQLPSVRSIEQNAEAAGLRTVTELSFGQHYAQTLKRWRLRFATSSEQVKQLGFDEVFCRMWTLYLAYSEAGFRSRYLDVVQFGLTKPA